MLIRAKYMMMLPVILALSGNVLAQSNNKSLYFWRLNSVSGEACLEAHYREQEQYGANINDTQHSTFVSGGILLNTKSSIIHPNFMLLDISAAYMPATSKDDYLVVPDLSEVRTVKKIDVGTTFFKEKPLTLSLFGNYDESYSSRENMTDIKSVNKHWGSTLNYSNKFLPVTLDFHNRKWEQEEIQAGRKYNFEQKLFSARTVKSFTNRDRNELRYSHDDNVNINQNLYRVANVIDNIDFISRISIDSQKKYSLNTVVSNINQHGNINLQRFQANETFYGQLPMNFSIFSSYNYYNSIQKSSKLQQHGLNTSLENKLYKSLTTRINFEYNNISHTVYKEFNTKTGFDINYSKKIPKGLLMIVYQYDRYHQDYTSASSALSIVSESYTLTDNQIVLLRLPEVNIASVVVKDQTGTLIYETGLDYILIQRDKYIEIRRIPGGLIANNSVVLVDYIATQPGSYKYDANSHVLNTTVYLLNNILSFNYRFSTQDYKNLESTEFVTLNYFTQNLVGFRVDFGYIYAGAEYEDYKSSILPYRMMRYYVNYQKHLGKSLMLMLNGNMQDYVLLDKPEPEYQKYMDVTGKAIYTIHKQTLLNVDLMYRKQKGSGIDLDLLTARTEITSTMNRLNFTLGVELYRRLYVGESLNFKGAYAKIVRKF